MSRLRSGLLTIGLLTLGCSQSAPTTTAKPSTTSPAVAAPAKAAAAAIAVGDYVIGEPVRFQNLTIFPVSSRSPKTDDRFVTLDEGLRAGTVEILEAGTALAQSENTNGEADPESPEDAVPSALNPTQTVAELRGPTVAESPFGIDHYGQLPGHPVQSQQQSMFAGNDVNSLIVINRSDKPLYLMPGEVIIGGSQDRTIGDEVVIAPHSAPTRISVFCVEHGRWGAKHIDETRHQLTASAGTAILGNDRSHDLDRLAEAANQGKFVASVGQLSKSSRLAVQSDKDQSAVWEKVAQTNGQTGVSPLSGAFTANYSDGPTIQRLQPYLEHLQSAVANQDQVVGVLAAVNGKIESMDVFESTPLFQKVWPKLLRSYALDAANSAERETDAKDCEVAAARTFLEEALAADVETTDQQHGIAMTKRSGRNVVSFSSQLDSAAAPAAMGGMGGGVHFSGFSK